MKVVDGSLRIRSRRTARAYVGADAPPLADAEGFVDTGDMVERRGERYHFVGRRGGIINIGGLKVHPEEVEAAINRHVCVQMSRARSRKSPITGAIVVADVILADGTDAAHHETIRAEILSQCKDCMAAWKVPAVIRFVDGSTSRQRENWCAPMRNVLVTGGSRGIGLAIARGLAASGDYNVIAVARPESGELAAALRETQRRLHFRACDLGLTETIPVFAKSVRDEFGAIYGLFNNAGIGIDGLLATMHNSEIESLIRLNVLSPIILTKYVARRMMADGAGRIVNISSIVASTGYSGLSVYAASKAALAGFTRSLAREVGEAASP